MNICVVGSGAREHALADAFVRQGHDVVASPGNPGIATIAACSAEIPTGADLYVIGPEAPLVAGLADRLRQAGNLVFGPGADGARLEGSKAWMKDILADAGVPTARHGTFRELEPAIAFLKELPGPWVVKTDGLAAGKGVLVARDLDEAAADVEAKLTGASFGEAGRTVVIEEGLTGPELSVLAICDGTRAIALPAAQDFKRVGDGDAGPNTGGMGACSPVAFAIDAGVTDEVMEKAVKPTMAALRSRGIDYRGVLYAGLMLTPDGLRVLEYNVRFGDPETEVVVPRLQDDLADWLSAAAGGRLPAGVPNVAPDACVTVVMASAGYPGAPATGQPITGQPITAPDDARVRVFHAGTATDVDGQLVSRGGRVLAVTGLGDSLGEARERAYTAVRRISFDGAHYRTDIAS